MTTRRRFLRGLGLGVFSSAAFLLGPRSLLARCRRGGGVCLPPPCSGPYYPVPGLMPGMTPFPLEGGRPLLLDDIGFDYPKPTGITIPGGGDFCVWGTFLTGASMIKLLFTDSSGTLLGTQPSFQSLSQILDTGHWGFAVKGYAGQSNFYLAISYVKNGTSYQYPAPPLAYGPFST